MKTLICFLLATLALAACSNDTPDSGPKAVYFQELAGGTCGEVQPLSDDLGAVCDREELGGVTFTQLQDTVWTIGCETGDSELRFDTEKHTGRFDMRAKDCRSSYALTYR